MATKLLSAFAAGAMLLAAQAAHAAWPEKPIMMIVAYGAGGSTDVTARMLAPFIEKHLPGARILVANKPGAGGEIGFAAIADAAPDGHTIGFINSPNVVTIPIERSARHALDRLDPLVNIVDDPGAMTVRADSPYKTLADLVAEAGKTPGRIAVGSTGVGSDDHLAKLLLQRQASVRFLHAPFPSGAEGDRAMLGGHIAVSAQNLGEALRSVQANPVRILGVMSATRVGMAPDLPTFKEQGFDIVMNAMRGIAAPKGLPADIRAKLVDAIVKAANDPDFQAKARETFQPLRVLGPDAFGAELTRLDADFRQMWKEQPWR